MLNPVVQIALPAWARERFEAAPSFADDAARMAFVIELSRENVRQGTGGPFAAAVFERESGALVAIGPNLVFALQSSVMHAEVVAILLAQRAVGSGVLRGEGLPEHMLFTSCEPCAMCLGAVLWSGVRRLVCAAARDDAQSIGFDEGPVFPKSYEHLQRAGIDVVRELMRADANAVLQDYARSNGHIYNG